MSCCLADLEASIEEARYALDVLKADGVVLLGNARGRYFAEEEFHPLLAELNARRAVLYCHPNFLPGGVQPGMPPFVAGFYGWPLSVLQPRSAHALSLGLEMI